MHSSTENDLFAEKWDLKACPVCSGTNAKHFLSLHYPELGYPGEFALKTCNDCGLLFNSPRLRDDLLALLYDRNYYIFLERPQQAVTRIQQLYQQTAAVLETKTTQRQILEVGCAKGYLLALLANKGWTVRGVELSQFAAEFAASKLNIQTHCGTVEEWISSPEFEPMPIVISTDVIEHVNDLDSFVQALNIALSEDGLLLLGTPNGDARGIELHRGRWLGFNPFHISILSRNNLEILLNRHGFTVELAYTYNNLEPAVQPLPTWRTQVVTFLDKIGLLQIIRQMKHKLTAMLDELSIPLKNRIATAAQQSPTYFFETPDGLNSDAMHCRGDNLVIIARKHSNSELRPQPLHKKPNL